MLQDIKELLESMTLLQKAGIAVIIALMLAYSAFVTASQQAGFEEHRTPIETITLMTDKGPVKVSKEDYVKANERWRQAHPEDYDIVGVDDE